MRWQQGEGPPQIAGLSVRTGFVPGDLGVITTLHGRLYAEERGWDARFEAYVAEGLARFVLADSPRQCAWLAEESGRLVGVAAIAEATDSLAQLRWFLVVPQYRGRGLGTWLLKEAVAFCRQMGYARVFLWTTSDLSQAAALYRSLGFAKSEEVEHEAWGANVVEERYDLDLRDLDSRR